MDSKIVEKKLVRVFCEAFPVLNKDTAPQATIDNTEGWDSLAMLTLFTLIEERMGVKIGYDSLLTLKSFDDIKKEIEKSA